MTFEDTKLVCLSSELRQGVGLLNQPDGEILEWTNQTQLLQEAESLLDSMKTLDLSRASATANQELTSVLMNLV